MKKGEIWLVNIPSSYGHEQKGYRPVILFSRREANVIAIIPLTSNLKYNSFTYSLSLSPSPGNGLKENSVALVFQIRVIDTEKLTRKIGTIGQSSIEKIDEILKEFLIL